MRQQVRGAVRRLRDESGMALVMAIGTTATIAIMGGSLVLYSTSNERTANTSKANLRAYTLAQSGIDAAASVIAQQPITGRNVSTIFSSMTTANRTLTFGTGESVVYNGTLYDDTPGGVSGTPLYRAWRWALTATSVVPNPNPGGVGITRTISATMLLSPVPIAPTVQSQAWKYVYSKTSDASTATCEVSLPNNPNFRSSFYVNGTLCLTNSAEINGNAGGVPAVDVIAKEGIYLGSPQSYIGGTTTVQRVETNANQCKYRTGPWGSACIPANHVTGSAIINPPATVVAGPTTSFTDTALLANPGPQFPCQTRSGSFPDFAAMTGSSTFNLTGSSYVCKNAAGELSYDSSTNILTVKGLIYFPGNVTATGNKTVRYQGVAAIYIGGTYNQQQLTLCAAVTGSACNWTGWDTTSNVLLIAAAGAGGPLGGPSCTNGGIGSAAMLLEQSAGFQGALYADGTQNICYQNNSNFQGPSVAYAQVFDNSVSYMPMPVAGIVNVPFGAPGQTSPVTDYNVTPPINYSG